MLIIVLMMMRFFPLFRAKLFTGKLGSQEISNFIPDSPLLAAPAPAGSPRRFPDSFTDGYADGIPEGSPDNYPHSFSDGSPNGLPNGSTEG